MRRKPSQVPVKEVSSVGELLNEIGSTVNFSNSQLTEMFSACEERGEDFLITCNNRRYRVPALVLSEHFQTHPRPEKPMTVEQENEFLRQQLRELKQAFGKSKIHGSVQETAAEKMVPEYIKDEEEKSEAEAVDEILDSIPDDIEEVPDAPFIEEPVPKKDPAIPVAGKRISDKMSMEEIQEELKKDLKGKKPIRATDPPPVPAGKKEHSPKANEDAL